ncbi:dihydroorotase [Paenibacillus thiaminolyticus]|uniref:Dihydroorotase n=1 Tax=Paenibacillus thiaminolyticus TaxID=49283 RepID=A0AAP9DY41_PANTH|nr:dihydroorotase [Paenibacillus thiaminolyticus]MCY9533939.1 dihydroorotase [Paenibacillus thiaminolyticus]MCY9601902.1 dihydroorotase [Paenibacillus thiaminolyticus]MCY9606966.1 dihydroorotase [Paenibacillus thiaminolyticus]MCY9614346.1 dihydroorotase [Paenibacillus thiaminolyticus]MCY9619097.1 dihydroorotase [Paenibacillus thiaminolyticus]
MLVIANANILNEAGELQLADLWIEDGQITKIVPAGSEPAGTAEVCDVEGKFVSAGFIDMHVHLREPGFEHKETIATGTHSAAKGGFTTIACMPNTRPVLGTPETIRSIYDKAEAEGIVKVLPYASITVNELGRELTDFAALKEAGAIGFTDDGVGVQNAQVMKDAMTLAKELDMPVIAHCEDDSLVKGRAVTEGEFARKHGLKGIPNESEAIHVGRDILLAEATGVHYHVCHVSTEQSIRLIRQAKQLGIRVTAEVCPHHLLLSDEDIPGMDTNWKMNPPLRSPRDVAACIEGLEDGTIDILVTDHAPHSEEEKAKGMELAPFGIVGLETAFPLLYTRFVATGKWTLSFLIGRMTTDPANVFGLSAGRLEPGAPADITVIDLEAELEVNPEQFLSKGRNTPFTGWKLKGWPVMTLVDGRIVWSKQ